MDAKDIISRLKLEPHPEGGFYRRVFTSEATIAAPGGERPASSAILYLLDGGDRSRLHRLCSEELWFHLDGQALEVGVIEGGRGERRTLDKGSPCTTIPAGRWFGARIPSGSGWALVSCVVTPGFDFADFKLGDPARLTREFPDLAQFIEDFS